MTASCVYLWILRSFSDRFFYRVSLGNCLFHVQVAGFQPLDAAKMYFTGAFEAFYTRKRSSYSKAFIYLKFLKIFYEEVNLWWSCEMPTCKLTKKPLSHILLLVFCLHFLRIHHDYFFRRGFVRAQFLSGNISGKYPHKKINRCLTNINQCLTDFNNIFSLSHP